MTSKTMPDIDGGSSFFSDPSQWTYHRMTASQPVVSVTPETAQVVTPTSLGLEVRTIQRPATWHFAVPPPAEKDPRHPAFSRVRLDSLVLASEQAVTDALDAVAKEYQELLVHEESPTLTSELEHFKKFTIQKGTYGPWYVQQLGGGHLTTTLPPVIQKIVAHVAAVYAMHSPRKPYPAASDPADTNGGWPTFITHPLAKIAGGIIAETDPTALRDNAEAVAQGLNLDQASCLANGLSGRSGPVYKLRPLTRFTGSGWEHVGTWNGYAQRNRIVHMSSYAVNLGLRPVFTTLHDARMNIPGLWHAANKDFYLTRQFTRTYESDISGFDVSVTRELQTLIAWHLGEAFPRLRPALKFLLFAETLPMIAPHWGRDSGACSVMTFLGGTRSGLKTTAEVGTMYSTIAALYALHRQGVPYSAWPYYKDMALLIQGDDVLIASNKPVQTDDWADAYSRMGLKSKLVPGDMFLSRHHDLEGQPFPCAGRIIQQTLSNEHEKTGDPAIVDGLLILGFTARSEMAQRIPSFLSQAAARCCRHADWLTRYLPSNQFSTLADMRTYLLTSATANQAVQRALEASANLPWLLSEYRAREHSPSAAIIADFIERMRPDLLTQSVSLNDTVAKIIGHFIKRQRSERIASSIAFSRTLMNERSSSDIVFNRLTIQYL